MYSNYTGTASRSRSATNIVRESNYFKDDVASCTASKCSTLSRGIVGRGRRGDAAAPQRSKHRNSHHLGPDDESPTCSRSYLADGIRRQFELGFESSSSSATSAAATAAKESPRSNSFVKRLVATLERRQHENNAASKPAARPVGDEFYARSFSRDFVGTTTGEAAMGIRTANGEAVAQQRFKPDQPFTRRPLSQLEDVYEDENEDDYDDLSDSGDFKSNSPWRNKQIVPPLPARNFPTPSKINKGKNYNFIISNNNNNNDDKRKNNNIPDKPSVRRSLKNMFTSLISWRGAKSLPKGSRDYYAARESLGEEMRTFRRDTMPQLMRRRATLHQESSESESSVREFSQIIGTGEIVDEELCPSIATIHPAYGCKSAYAHSRLSRYHQQALGSQDEHQEPIYECRNVEPPTVPVRRDLSPAAEHLLRPSKVKNLQKRLSREVDVKSIAQPRQYPINSSSDVIYDVPRSNRPVSAEITSDIYYVTEMRRSPPKYANLNGIINNDSRLHPTAFTTF